MRHQLVGEAFGEVLLLGIAGQISQRQDSDGANKSWADAGAGSLEHKFGGGGSNHQRQSNRQGDPAVPGERFGEGSRQLTLSAVRLWRPDRENDNRADPRSRYSAVA